MSLSGTRVPGADLASIMALALMCVMTLLAQAQAAPPYSSLQDHTRGTGLHRSGEDLFNASNLPDEDVAQLRALKNHRTNQRLYKTSLPRENKNLQARALKTQRSAQTESAYVTETPLHYFLKDHRQGRPLQQTSRVPSYTASDLAEYIYKTGDEDGVSLALQELTQEGMMSPEEALRYLHDVRKNLQYLIQEEEDDRHNYQEEVMKDLSNKSQLSMGMPEMNGSSKHMNSEIDHEDQLTYQRNAFGDYSDNDYSFEEVIYQLAKLLFAQTQQRDGSDGSEKMMDLVIDLLDQETQEGKITPEAHDKALDVMMNSLVDVVKENEIALRLNVTQPKRENRPKPDYSSESNTAFSRINPVISGTIPPNKGPKPAYSGSNLAFIGSNPGSRLMIRGSEPAFSGSIPAYNGPKTAYGGPVSAFSRINTAYSGTNPAYSRSNPANSGSNNADSGVNRKLVPFYYPKVRTNDKSTSQKDIKENEVIDD